MNSLLKPCRFTTFRSVLPSAPLHHAFPESEFDTPVAFFVFNRPHTTAQVFGAIRRARPRLLLVIADGPRPTHGQDEVLCGAVRKIVTGVDWPCDLRTDFSDQNLGCRSRVASGLRWVFEQVDRAIILEDDCMPEPTFFAYCAELLTRYQDDPTIGMIAGTNYQLKPRSPNASYFASAHFSIWGWATWRRAISGYDENMRDWRRSVRPPDIRPAASHLAMHWLHVLMFDLAVAEQLDTWDVAWTFHLVRQSAVSLVPGNNLISNIGSTGTRARVGDPNNFLSVSPLALPLRPPAHLGPNHSYDRFVTGRYRLVRDYLRASLAGRTRRWIRRIKPPTHFRLQLLCLYRRLRSQLARQRRRGREAFLAGVAHPSNLRRALLIHLVEPFLAGAADVRHQNRGQALDLAAALAARGFRVDVAAPGATTISHAEPYDLVVDLHPGLTSYPFGRDTLHVAYITGSNPTFANQAERQRLTELAQRRGFHLQARRQVPEFSRKDLGACSAMWFIGNGHNLATFEATIRPPRVSFITNFAYPIPHLATSRRDPRHFLFLSSGGQVHKGLDLLLEVFRHRPEWTLHVCSNFHEEADFCRAFRRELFCSPNILPHGFQRLDGPAFQGIAASCTFLVLPSCSEANAGSVISAMAIGCIPIVSQACGFETGEVVYFPDCSIDQIDRTLVEQSARPSGELQAASRHARMLAETKYSMTAYRTSLEHALNETLAGSRFDETRLATDPTHA